MGPSRTQRGQRLGDPPGSLAGGFAAAGDRRAGGSWVAAGRRVPVSLCFAISLCIAGSPLQAAPADRKAEESFEARVRPILAERCTGCHGSKKSEAGLRLDSQRGFLRGSDKGLIITPEALASSRILEVLRHEGEVRMPPREKLPAGELETIEAWVLEGAPWPADREPGPATGSVAQAHWAFQPIRDPEVPDLGALPGREWARSPIDAFILANLAKHSLEPSQPADPRTLLRRLFADLTGLPPSPGEVEELLGDASIDSDPTALGRVVDRLLDSPRYGERWGRHWLDVARYADTKGYVFQEERRYPYAYTYRDYVIRSMNEDLPYDRFVVEQLAADLVVRPDGDPGALAAMGFLTLGRRFLNNIPDIIDDRLDVISRGLMGLTVTCARCHDHKFDPIPQADYYSLYGVLASAREPQDLPLIAAPEETDGYRVFQQGLAAKEKAVADGRASEREKLLAEMRSRTAEYLLAAAIRPPPGDDLDKRSRNLAEGELHPRLVARWRAYLEKSREAAGSPALRLWNALTTLPADMFAQGARELIARAASGGEGAVNPRVLEALRDPPATLEEAAKRYAQAILEADSESPEEPADPAREELRLVLRGDGAPLALDDKEVDRLFNRAARNRLRELEQAVEAYKASSPDAPPRAMSLAESDAPTDPVIFLRGNPNLRGDPVPRRFLAALSPPERKPFEHGSGRLELARAIASPDNPLSARVLVNRIWMHHFGEGLVRTPGDFGTRCEPPEQLELLDYLASRLIEDGWSLKRLHRRIILSSTYLQASDLREDAARIDPEERLLWRHRKRRLDFEGLRDGILAVAGNLDLRMGGPAVDITSPPYPPRRSVFAFIDRQNLPGLFRTFDLASPDTTTPQRHSTTVPQQALFLLNSPFIIEEARSLAARAIASDAKAPADLVSRLYRLALGRPPAEDELELASRFLSEGSGESQLAPLELLAQAVLLSNEFAFID